MITFKKVLGWLILSSIIIFIYYALIMNIIHDTDIRGVSTLIIFMTGLGLFLRIILWALKAIT